MVATGDVVEGAGDVAEGTGDLVEGPKDGVFMSALRAAIARLATGPGPVWTWIKVCFQSSSSWDN